MRPPSPSPSPGVGLSSWSKLSKVKELEEDKVERREEVLSSRSAPAAAQEATVDGENSRKRGSSNGSSWSLSLELLLEESGTELLAFEPLREKEEDSSLVV